MAIHIKQILDEFLKNKKDIWARQKKIEQIVNPLIKDKMKKHIYLKKVLKNCLVFASDSSSFSYEFSLKKGEIIKEIKKEFPEIERIRIELGR